MMGYQILFRASRSLYPGFDQARCLADLPPEEYIPKSILSDAQDAGRVFVHDFSRTPGQDQNPCRLQARPSARQRDGRWQNHLVGDHLVHGFHIKIDHGRTLVFRNIHVNIRITQAGVNCFHDKRIAAVAHDDDKFREIPGHLVRVAGSAYSIIAPGTCGGGAMVMKTGQFSSQHLE